MGPGVGGIGTARELLLADDGTGAGVGGVGTGSVRHWTVDGDCTGWGGSTVYGDCMGDGSYVSDTQRTWSVRGSAQPDLCGPPYSAGKGP
ncbi:uncharacterized protein ATNIH1004_002085 [Aspergillus tanneri]|uniref:Uncharacterized protein n=1 Tax=Aspergillus tanneri TaxID=1220188 RepID=A0A5M9MVK2_9EURO|nr:uncharacterized protein ATNIH1004_005316 [Aspergillus tanneri]XP_033428775.1 uncharacterized protein ATNIH1004_002085 [Aspergillus tanneri]KAA8646641.1 hypothetical protein ATNIH1004_005316 [Aspergillus tanneri]KAA8649414.1 hypothetical protein ATNIH1004_002085 [Aspergillus tanneri]